MLTPPRLLTLVHAVQQPIGAPRFTALAVQHQPYGKPRSEETDAEQDETTRVQRRTCCRPCRSQHRPDDRTGCDHRVASPNSTDAFLLGGLEVHAASTDRIEMLAEWADPVDDPSDAQGERRSEVSTSRRRSTRSRCRRPAKGTFTSLLAHRRACGSRISTPTTVCCVWHAPAIISAPCKRGRQSVRDAAPRHRLGDTQRHRITYDGACNVAVPRVFRLRARSSISPDRATGRRSTCRPRRGPFRRR